MVVDFCHGFPLVMKALSPTVFLVVSLSLLTTGNLWGEIEARRVLLGNSGLSMALPPGWRNAEKAPDNQETFGAFQSQDRSSSLFLSSARASAQADMSQIMDSVVANFESAFIVNEVGEFKNGRLADSLAIFTTLEADLRSANGPNRMAFRFYLAVIDTGTSLTLVQASVQAPVNPAREKEVMAMIRSLVKVVTSPETPQPPPP